MGHGGLYHSQSPEAYFCHTPGLRVVMPSGPADAKGLLLSSIRSKDPVIFFEPKVLYRSSVEEVPEDDYEIELGKANIVQSGDSITVVGYGSQIHVIKKAAEAARVAEKKQEKIKKICKKFNPVILDKSKKSFVIQVTALRAEIDKLTLDLRRLGLISTSRTGAVAMTKGAKIFS